MPGQEVYFFKNPTFEIMFLHECHNIFQELTFFSHTGEKCKDFKNEIN